MKIIQLTSSNVLNLTAVTIKPNRNLVTITGANGAGKSNVLQSIWMALGGSDAIPAQPIRRGASEATIQLDLGNGKAELVVVRRITQGGTTLIVKDAEGNAQRTPQAILDSLIGDGFIDPLALSRCKSVEQLATLRNLAGLDFTKEEQEREKLYQERTLVNREADAAAKRLAGVPFDAAAPTERVQIADLTAKLAEAERSNRENVQRRAELSRFEMVIKSKAERIDAVKLEILEMEKSLADTKAELARFGKEQKEFEQRQDKLRKEVAKLVDIDTGPLRARIDGAEAVNRSVDQNIRHQALKVEHATKLGDAKTLSAQIDAIDQRKARLIRLAKFPLPGLSVDDAGILFNGLPLSQASTAEQLKVWTAVAMALNPRLRVLFIRDGSLLDESSLKIIAEMAEKNDFQVLMEDARSTDPSAIVIEDGHVRT